MPHSPISPAILYWGTPVVLISTTNPGAGIDRVPSYNIAPISSAFWLGDRCIIGIASHSQTALNIMRTKQCVLNLPAYEERTIAAVNALARTTGTVVVPAKKISLGYTFVKDKFGVAKLTPDKSALVEPPRIMECAVQMEAEMVGCHKMFGDLGEEVSGFTLAIELKILKTYVEDELRMSEPGKENRIDPDKWRPMIMSFQQLYGLGPRGGSKGQVDTDSTTVELTSKLAEIDEELYRMK